MVALQPDRTGRLFAFPAAASWAGEFDIFVDELAVVNHFYHPGIGGFLSVLIKTGRAEGDVKGLPLAGRLAGIDAGRMAFDIFFLNPAAINSATFDSGIFIL